MRYAVKVLVVLLVAATCQAGITSRDLADPNVTLGAYGIDGAVIEGPEIKTNENEMDGVTFWGLTGDGANHVIATRLGLVRDRVEAGGTIKGYTARPKWGPEIDAAGGYMIFHINEFVTVTDPLPNAAWENFLHRFMARPYVGIEAVVPTQGSQRTMEINWLTGTMISTDANMRRALVIEYSVGQSDPSNQVVSIGAFIRF